MARAIVLHGKDNVATLIDQAKAGTVARLTGEGNSSIEIRSDIPFGHKCAVTALAKGDDIVKYGQIIGRATADISIGDHVHIHNVEALRARGDR